MVTSFEESTPEAGESTPTQGRGTQPASVRDPFSESPIIGTAAAGMTSPEPMVEIIPRQELVLGDAQKYEAMHAANINALVVEAMNGIDKLMAIEQMTTLEQLSAGARDYEEVSEVASRLSGRASVLDKRIEDEFVKPSRTLWQNSLKMQKAVTGSANELLPRLRKALTTARLTIERKQAEIEEARQAEIRRQEEERQRRIALEKQEHEDHLAAIKENYERDLAAHEAKVRLYADWDAALAEDHERAVAALEAKRKKEAEDATIRQAEAAEAAGASKAHVDSILDVPKTVAPVTQVPPAPVPTPLPPPPPKPAIKATPYIPPPPAPVPTPAAAAPLVLNTKGKVQSATIWKGRVLSKRKVLEQIIEGNIDWAAITINQSWFDGQAAKGKETAGIPGVWESFPEGDTRILKNKD